MYRCKEVYRTVEKSGVGEERNKRTERKRRGIVNDILTAYQPDKDTSRIYGEVYSCGISGQHRCEALICFEPFVHILAEFT